MAVRQRIRTEARLRGRPWLVPGMREVLSPKNRAGLDCPRIIRMIVNCESNLFAELS
jgi:hypothetical protein